MLIPKILRKVIKLLNLKHRTIYRRFGEPYLTRYYIFRKPKSWMPSIYIHCFHSSDEDMELHSHPWLSSVSLILSGSYKEEYRDKHDIVKNRILNPGNLNFIKSKKFHRVDLLNNEVWTLFISGSKISNWGFWNRNTKEYWPQEEHEKRKNPNKTNDSTA